MKRIQVKFVKWMEFKVKDDFDVNSLVGIDNMDLEEVVEITGDQEWEEVELEDYFQDVRFIEDQIWFDEGGDNNDHIFNFDKRSQTYKKRKNPLYDK
jgi:hypothetical protein